MNRFPFRSLAMVASLSMFVAACPPPVPAADGGNEAGADVVVDSPDPPYNSLLFGRCRNDGDCTTGFTCKTEAGSGWSGGFCTRTCSRSSDCEANAAPGTVGICAMHDGEQICLRECLNGFDCGREGYTCLQLDPNDTSEMPARVCRPSCTESSCTFGSRCNAWTGRCQAESAPLPPPGQDVGESCMQNGATNNCRSGDCVPAQNTRGVYTGWNNGYCTSACTLPSGWNNSTLWPDTTFPRGNCPTGSICFPDGDPGIAERDPGTCYHECRSDSDCRASEGYTCRRTFTRGNNRPFTWQNGICVPGACDPAPGAPDTCPSGYYCESQVRVQGTQRVTVGVCRPGSRPEPTVEPGPEPTVEAGTPADAANEAGSDSGPDSSSDSSSDSGADAGADASADADPMDAMG